MKVLKVILLLLALVAAAVGGVMLFLAMNVELKVIWEIATRYSTDTDLRDPRPNLLIITGIAAGAGLLLGLAIGLPTRMHPSQKKVDATVEARVQERMDTAGGQPGTVPPDQS